ncbi:hypothetical protein FC87_GL000050 [Fructilactobacillus florum DSM 22689 = JCM 16035]|uniref:Uncharacterized protein n=1 Tax=Fructilactobacillus florum DSM 22689 = JCM 16035 TaxID=1423745 RepID=A0A0R2CX99_9LACO|nr:hypothetical protein FC87_GL000050 [Fructilactobacillus florum DSM 22689 = JCM 16035]
MALIKRVDWLIFSERVMVRDPDFSLKLVTWELSNNRFALTGFRPLFELELGLADNPI